eukprot:TRINITY_DN3956_c3_g2_i1.p1 TRINITY_DN3956_c3_g2~~TRINITY_DN3956_c3_g2_i1.p1  ORF type:complete len:106 (+),score=11.63 TRINITY_DN3956_c3_g2_i1:1879-2196(+)
MKFFHRITKANFRRNFIHFLINKDGKKIQNKYQSMKMCWSYFNNIFNDQKESSGPMILPLSSLKRIMIKSWEPPRRKKSRSSSFLLERTKLLAETLLFSGKGTYI